jgi:hypothetical protein
MYVVPLIKATSKRSGFAARLAGRQFKVSMGGLGLAAILSSFFALREQANKMIAIRKYFILYVI